MNAKLLAVLSAVLIVGVVPFMISDGEADGASLDDAPDAKYVIDLGDYTFLKGSASKSFDLLDAFGSQTGLDQLSTYQGIYIGGFNTGGIPGWISVEKSYTGTMYEDFVPDVQLVVNPTYVAASTDYWVHSSLMGGILWTITVEVEDSDPTVTPEGTYTYNVVFDTHGGSSVGPITHDSHNDSWTVDLSKYVPTKDGYEFKGWSPDASGETMYGSTLTMNGIKGDTVSVTVHAIWEESHLVIPTFWDGLIELISNPIILLVGLILFLAVCLFIRNRTGGYA